VLTPLTPRHLAGLPVAQRPLVMGVVNVTPDSFSDGGRYDQVDLAVEHGRALLAEGADLVDIGGESTRPGATRPLVSEELARVIPVIEQLAGQGAVVSVDTMRAEVAAAAIAAGASLVNDVSGGLADPEILEVAAERQIGYLAMHWRAHSTEMQQRASYADVVAEVCAELRARVQAALAAGIAAERLAIDPGLGFAKTAEHNWQLLQHLEVFDEFGLPVLLGSSRKSFLGSLLADEHGEQRPVLEREDAGVALTTLAGLAGVWAVRVHQVRGTVDALKVVSRWQGRPFGTSAATGKVVE
jgi:dihydropteroate synthase